MKIENSTKYYSVLIGSLFIIIWGIISFINYIIQYDYITNYFSGGPFINPTEEAVLSVEHTIVIMLILLLLSVILVIIAVKFAKNSFKNAKLSGRNGMAILIIGIILFSFGAGDYIGSILIVLGGFAFFAKEGDIVVRD